MQLLSESNFHEVWASAIGDYVVLWSSDYPSKRNFICTCEDLAEAREIADLYIHCKDSGIDWDTSNS